MSASPPREPEVEGTHSEVLSERGPAARGVAKDTAHNGAQTPERERWFYVARGHAFAARALVDDPLAPSWTAREHVRSGWRALVLAGGAVLDESSWPSALDECPWLGAEDLSKVAEFTVSAPDSPVADDIAAWHSELLLSAVDGAERAFFGARLRRQARAQLLRRVGLGAIIAIPVIAGLVVTAPDYREGPWRGAYYATADFTGEPHVQRDSEIDFNFKYKGPGDLPRDKFSIRWDSCIEIDETVSASLQLISDDGARLWIDDVLVIDNWGVHSKRSRGATIQLDRGIHHVRVDYFERALAASVSLKASLDGDRPTDLPTALLRYPGEELDETDVCKAARGAQDRPPEPKIEARPEASPIERDDDPADSDPAGQVEQSPAGDDEDRDADFDLDEP
jgi:hypothetical protein